MEPTTDRAHADDRTTRRAGIAVARRALMATRILAGVIAGLVLVQGALAGSHLSGDAGVLAIHEFVGTEVLTVLALAAVVTATAAIRLRSWALPATLLGFLATGLQIGMGFADRLRIHVPLGLALLGLYLALALTPTEPERNST
jgi:hypothetical protein